MRYRTIALIFIMAFLLRSAFIFVYQDAVLLDNAAHSPDGTDYDLFSRNILEGKGGIVPDVLAARRPPAYPIFLAGIYFLSGNSRTTARFAQGLLGAFSCVIVYLLTRELFSQTAALIAAFLLAIDYYTIEISAFLLSETLYTFLFLHSLLFILYYYKRKKIKYIFPAGICAGIAALCREIGVFLIPLGVCWLAVFSGEDLKHRLKIALVFFLFCLLPILPWAIRNYFIFHDFVPITASSGHSLYMGNNPRTVAYTGGYDMFGFLPRSENQSGLFTPQTDAFLKTEAVGFMLNNPAKTVFYAGQKFVNMWQPYYLKSPAATKAWVSLTYYPAIIFGLFGMFLFLRKSSFTGLLLGTVIFYALLHIFSLSCIRFRLPLMPILMIYAGAFACHILPKQGKIPR